jgi:hypothetical protein
MSASDGIHQGELTAPAATVFAVHSIMLSIRTIGHHPERWGRCRHTQMHQDHPRHSHSSDIRSGVVT